MASLTTDWDPGTYSRFRGLRLRPALDLLHQVGPLAPGDVIDLGCGDGAMAPALLTRFPKRQVIGVDASPAMLEKTRGYKKKILADIATWTPADTPALIYSNAALQWLPDHATLFPRLVGLLPAEGILAVQMPRQTEAPSHTLLREIAARLFPDRFDPVGPLAAVQPPSFYARLLATMGEVSVWETEYHQRLAPVFEGHPVRHFTQSTAMRPYAEQMTAEELSYFIAAYDLALEGPYPAEADGSVLFPFRRLFITLTKG